MKCVNVRGKPFECFEIQNQRTSFLLLWSVFYFYILKPLLSGAQCSAEVSHRSLYTLFLAHCAKHQQDVQYALQVSCHSPSMFHGEKTL